MNANSFTDRLRFSPVKRKGNAIRAVVLLAVGLVWPTNALSAPELYGVSLFGKIYHIDQGTGFATLLGSSGHVANAAASDQLNRMYVAGGAGGDVDLIFQIDTSTGNIIPGATLTMLNRPSGYGVRGLAFDPAGFMYAIFSQADNQVEDIVAEIDRSSGTVSIIGGTTKTGLQGFAIDPTTARWYAMDGSDGLIELNPTSGAAIATSGIDLSPNVQALEFDFAGTLFGAREDLITINPVSGALVSVRGPHVNTSDIRGLALILVDPQTCTVSADCIDGNICTTDVCISNVCDNTVITGCCVLDAECADGLFCNGTETCDVVFGCQPGTQIDCAGLTDQCNTGVCNETTDACEIQPANGGLACDDGQFCTTGEVCFLGSCGGGSAADCSFLDDQCNNGVCNETSNACEQQPVPDGTSCTDDGLFCNGPETCASGVCMSSGDPCGGAPCNEVTDKCGCSSDADCIDGVACTLDLCNVGTCANVPEDLACDDSLYCNGAETCDGILGCQPGPPIDCSFLDNQCAVGSCNEATDECEMQPINQGLSCDDGDFCTTKDLCQASYCAGSPVSNCCHTNNECEDFNDCTTDTCEAPTQTCAHPPAPMGTACGSPLANECTDPDTCDAGGNCSANHAGEGGTCSGELECQGGACDPTMLQTIELDEGGAAGSVPTTAACSNDVMVIGGFLIDSFGDHHAAVWESPDGETWGPPVVISAASFSEVKDSVTSHLPDEVDPLELGFTGRPGSEVPVYWRRDGATGVWTEFIATLPAGLAGGMMNVVIKTEKEKDPNPPHIAVGEGKTPSGDYNAVYWRDVAAEAIALPELVTSAGFSSGANAVALGPDDGRIVVAGFADRADGSPCPAVWRENPSGSELFDLFCLLDEFPMDGVRSGHVLDLKAIVDAFGSGPGPGWLLAGSIKTNGGNTLGVAVTCNEDFTKCEPLVLPPVPGAGPNSTANSYTPSLGWHWEKEFSGTGKSYPDAGDPSTGGVATQWSIGVDHPGEEDQGLMFIDMYDLNDLLANPLPGNCSLTHVSSFDDPTCVLDGLLATYSCSGAAASRGTSPPHAAVLAPVPGFVEIDKNRYVSFRPSGVSPVAYKLDMVSSLFHPTATVSGWVGVPDANGIASLEANPVTRTWTESIVSITGCDITPVAEFELRASSDDGATFSPPAALRTTPQPGGGKWWGDTVGSFDGTEWSPPQGVTNIDDAVSVIKTWQVAAGSPEIPRSDIVPQEPNRIVNFNDVLFVIFAFQGNRYPFGCPADPCQDNIANPCP